MGHKINPKIFRIGVINTWGSKWFASKKNYIPRLRQDVVIRKFFMKKLKDAGICKVDIERGPAKLVINAHVVKPGMVIGRSGAGVEDLKKELLTTVLNGVAFKDIPLKDLTINIIEVSNPNINAQVVLDSMIMDIEKRMPFRRVMKQAIQRVEKAGAKGVRVEIAGRLNGADIARTEKLATGQLPMHTLRADIDYSRGCAATLFGKIGIKVWIYRGQVFAKDQRQPAAPVDKAV